MLCVCVWKHFSFSKFSCRLYFLLLLYVCVRVCVCLFCFGYFNNVDNDEETMMKVMMMMAMTCVRRRQISDLPHLKIVCGQQRNGMQP